MIITPERYFKKLLKLNKINSEVKPYLEEYVINKTLNENALVILYKEKELDNKVVDFYQYLIKKIHKIYKELLRDEPKTACECIKTITSLITQATITLEKQFNNDVELANEFITCIGLKELSQALYTYFNKGDISDIEKELSRVKEDLIFIEDKLTN